jgi:hypothetical protein
MEGVMATRKQALKVIEEFGGEVDWDVSYITATNKHICVDAPEGKLWTSSAAESFVVSWYCGPASEFWDEVIYLANNGSRNGT